jgi:hypothetical protein
MPSIPSATKGTKLASKGGGTESFHSVAELFEMDLEPSPLFRHVTFGSAQANDRVEGIFAAGRAALERPQPAEALPGGSASRASLKPPSVLRACPMSRFHRSWDMGQAR